MKKQKSRRETKYMKQTSLWLPLDMYGKLTQAGGDRGLGDEIRGRLEISLKADDSLRDTETAELMEAITRIQVNMPRDRLWHDDRFAFDVFEAAINHLLSKYQPRSAVQSESKAEFEALYGKDEKAETIGRILARAALMAARDKEEE
jgi:hypothetical protein